MRFHALNKNKVSIIIWQPTAFVATGQYKVTKKDATHFLLFRSGFHIWSGL